MILVIITIIIIIIITQQLNYTSFRFSGNQIPRSGASPGTGTAGWGSS